LTGESNKEAAVIGDKEERFQGKGTDLSALQAHIEEYLKNEGFKTQTSAPSAEGSIIQGHKGGWLAGVIAADRALTITTTGSPDDFTVRVGIGKWIEHLGVTAAETLLITPIFIVVDVPEMAWNIEVENKLMKNIRSFIDPSAGESAESAEPGAAEPTGSGQQAEPVGAAGSAAGSMSASPAGSSGSGESMSASPASPAESSGSGESMSASPAESSGSGESMSAPPAKSPGH
jgi:hypothetical protein